ncbi:MAG: patatin-like phospholipase family protein, partial [Chromatiales bacterium]
MMINDLRLVILSCITILVILSPGQTAAADASPDNDRPRIGLVLSGGGALGFAHIGVLKVLEEMRVPVDCIVGTSMGALVGGVYASGVGPGQMQAVIANTDIESLFDDKPPRSDIPLNIKRDDYRPLFDMTLGYSDGVKLPSGASAGYKFELFLKKLIGMDASVADMSFDELPTPYRATATDLETGEIKVFDKGELPRVMRASMSLPAIVAPTVIDDRAYIDGGLVRNLPVDIGRKLCGDVLIAVNLGTQLKPKEQVNNSLEVALQSIVILTEQNVRASLQELTDSDVLITPDPAGHSSSSFSSKEAIIARGVAAARVQVRELSRLSLSPDAYNAWRENRLSRKPAPLTVTEITAEVTAPVSANAVKQDIHEETGKAFDLEQLDRNITEIYGRGDFSYVGYSIVPNEDSASVVIKADSKPWGPGYLKFGLGAATDFTSPTQLNLAASYRRTWLNSLGAEWRTDAQIGYDTFLRTEFIQPLQLRDGLFVAPYALARRNFIQLYAADVRLGDIEIERYQGGLDMGISGSIGELR